MVLDADLDNRRFGFTLREQRDGRFTREREERFTRA